MHREFETPGVGVGGVVTDNVDPEGLGRVRVRIPGYLEGEGVWAAPFGGGSPEWGLWMIPPVGCQVALWFPWGAAEQEPRYAPGSWTQRPDAARTQVPKEAREAKEPHNVTSLSTENFAIELREIEGERRASLRSRKTDMAVILNHDSNTIEIRGTTAIKMHSDGLISIEAPIVEINGRVVRSGKGDL